MKWVIGFLLVSVLALGQSVVDAAHANKQQQATAPGTKVYTNEDLAGTGATKDAAPPAAAHAAGAAKMTPEGREIAGRIRAQKKRVASLQAHVDRLGQVAAERAHLDTPPPLTPALCDQQPERCEGRRAFAMDLQRSPRQLDEARQKLEQMQEAARKRGFPESVWNPE